MVVSEAAKQTRVFQILSKLRNIAVFVMRPQMQYKLCRASHSRAASGQMIAQGLLFAWELRKVVFHFSDIIQLPVPLLFLL